MLARHVLGYIPSFIVPGMCAFGTVFVFTRLLTPEQYGHYTLAINSMMLMNAICFTWLQTSLSRLLPQAVRDQNAAGLHAAAYRLFASVAAFLVVAGLVLVMIKASGAAALFTALAVALAVVRAFLNLNQSVHRSRLQYGRYNIIECGQALLGFGVGVMLVHLGLGAAGALLGVLIGFLVMAIWDGWKADSIRWADATTVHVHAILRLGLPLTIIYTLAFAVSTSDRFLLDAMQGPAVLGVYAAGYVVMDRISTILFMAVATPAFPLTIHKMEHEGIDAAGAQTRHTGALLLMITLPACMGLILCAPSLAALLIGPEFRSGALRVMPFIAVSGLLNGWSTHYFEHAFYLAKRTRLLFLTQGPAAVTNIGLNIVLIPRYGYMGAAYATVASYLLLLVLTIVIGRRIFPMRFSNVIALQAAIATLIMAGVLLATPSFSPVADLAVRITVGSAVYASVLLAFNTSQLRARLLRR